MFSTALIRVTLFCLELMGWEGVLNVTPNCFPQVHTIGNVGNVRVSPAFVQLLRCFYYLSIDVYYITWGSLQCPALLKAPFRQKCGESGMLSRRGIVVTSIRPLRTYKWRVNNSQKLRKLTITLKWHLKVKYFCWYRFILSRIAERIRNWSHPLMSFRVQVTLESYQLWSFFEPLRAIYAKKAQLFQQ